MTEPHFGTWEAAVSWLRDQPDRRELVLDAFYDDPLIAAAERYYSTGEWQAVSQLLRGRFGRALGSGSSAVTANLSRASA